MACGLTLLLQRPENAWCKSHPCKCGANPTGNWRQPSEINNMNRSTERGQWATCQHCPGDTRPSPIAKSPSLTLQPRATCSYVHSNSLKSCTIKFLCRISHVSNVAAGCCGSTDQSHLVITENAMRQCRRALSANGRARDKAKAPCCYSAAEEHKAGPAGLGLR